MVTLALTLEDTRTALSLSIMTFIRAMQKAFSLHANVTVYHLDNHRHFFWEKMGVCKII